MALSDVDVPGVETIPLLHDWPRWWPIVEVFRPGLFSGRVVYFDLANLIVARIDPLIEGEGFVIAPAPADPPPLHGRFASGVMAFDGGDTEIYDRFEPPATIGRLHGDQEWIEEVRPDARTFDPSIAVSFKGACQNGLPEGAVVLLCHGRPKPPEITAPWFRQKWDADV